MIELMKRINIIIFNYLVLSCRDYKFHIEKSKPRKVIYKIRDYSNHCSILILDYMLQTPIWYQSVGNSPT